MADKSDRGRGTVLAKDVIPELLAKIFARVAVNRAREKAEHRLRRHVPNPKPDDQIPN